MRGHLDAVRRHQFIRDAAQLVLVRRGQRQIAAFRSEHLGDRLADAP